MSKGSQQRPGDQDKFREQWEKIFGDKRKATCTQTQEKCTDQPGHVQKSEELRHDEESEAYFNRYIAGDR